MATKIESYQSFDGKLFESEKAAVTHEVMARLVEQFPELKVSVGVIQKNLPAIAVILGPILSLKGPIEEGSSESGCKAVQHSDYMVCKQCNMTWDVNDPNTPVCLGPQYAMQDLHRDLLRGG